MELNSETSHYITTHYNNLLSLEERIVIKYILTSFKQPGLESQNQIHKLAIKLCWIEECQSLLQLMADGKEKFETIIAKKIINSNSDKIFMNNCTKCNRLARTPHAKICRYCGYNWHK